jgi:hypothetical protein
VGLPHTLQCGETHRFRMQFRLPGGAPPVRSYVLVPLRSHRRAELLVRFDPSDTRSTLWEVDGVPPPLIVAPRPTAPVLQLKQVAEVHRLYDGPKTGRAYGIGWLPPIGEDSESAHASIRSSTLRARPMDWTSWAYSVLAAIGADGGGVWIVQRRRRINLGGHMAGVPVPKLAIAIAVLRPPLPFTSRDDRTNTRTVVRAQAGRHPPGASELSLNSPRHSAPNRRCKQVRNRHEVAPWSASTASDHLWQHVLAGTGSRRASPLALLDIT